MIAGSATASEHTSAFGFVQTLAQLVSTIEAAGMRIFTTVDHAAGAREVGLEMPPTVVLFYGHPRGGTPIMLAHPAAALDLPLRVLVREREDHTTCISFYPIVALLQGAGVATELASRLEPAQLLLVRAISR